MKDPKVTALVEQLARQVDELNKTWMALQAEGCWIRIEQLGDSTYDSPKSLKIKEVKQHISYEVKTNG